MLALALEAGRRRLAEQSIARGTFTLALIDGCLFGFVVARVGRAAAEPKVDVFIGPHAPSFVFTVETMNRALRHDGHGPRLEVRGRDGLHARAAVGRLTCAARASRAAC